MPISQSHKLIFLHSEFVTEAPVYLSYPHFYKADPKLLAAVEGLSPKKERHETFFKIQPVSVRRKNLKYTKSNNLIRY